MSEWKHGILQKYVTLITKGTTPTSIGRSFRESGVNYIKAECIDESGTLVSNRLAYIDLDTHEALRRSQLEKGDILFSIAGVLGRVMIIGAKTLPANINQALALIRIPSDAEIDRTYLRYYLVGSDVRNQITRINVQAAQANFSLGDVNRLVISFPTSLIEQKKIADILSTVDEVIEKTEAAIDKYQAIKAGMMQDLFTRGIDTQTGKLRPTIEEVPELYKVSELGWIPKEWEIAALSEVCGMKSGDGITSKSIDEYGKYPVYGGNGLRGYTASYTHEGSYILIGRQGALCGNVNRVDGKFYASEHAVVVSINSDIVVDWLSYILDSMNLNTYSEASAQPGLAVGKILRLRIRVPQVSEQRMIASVIQSLNTKVEAEKALYSKYNQIKQGLMADLLAGSVRAI